MEHIAIVLSVPAAEPVVGVLRDRLDPAASWGVGAHVTLLSPIPLALGTDPIRRQRLRAALEVVPSFDPVLSPTGWFGQDVLWLDPTPARLVAGLLDSVGAVFPDVPPYEGRYPEARPHLTIGRRPLATVQDLLAAERVVRPALPIVTRAEEVHVLEGVDEPGRRRIAERILLAD